MIPRLAIYGLASTTLATGVVYSALKTRENFYAASVAVGRSSGSLMVLANFALFNAICLGIGLKKVFFGQLRAIEYEHLFERLWIFLTESLLALTIFRDDFSAPFACMYGLLLFLKCFHWITADRVDYMDQIPPPGPPKTFHFRIASIIILLASFDLLLASYSIDTILTEGVSAMVLFASEFTILQASILGTSARYVVNVIDLRRARGRADAPSWEEKSMYMFYIDLAVDFVKLLTYLCFFSVILLHYGLPLHILRDVYMTLRSFVARCGDLIRYRRATRDMDAMYPDATEEEMERLGDRTCIICREEMIPRGSTRPAPAEPIPEVREGGDGVEGVAGGPNETPKKLACGHVFHFHCLRSWLERQQSCPTCRRDVLRTPAPPPIRAAQNRAVNIVPPPAPAPGAVPQPPQPAQPRATDGAAIQQAYNEYFSLPQAGQVNPVQRNTDSGATTAAAGPSVERQQDSDDARVQRGIWGAPIVPGRFFHAPLGAAPRLPSTPVHPSSTSIRPIGTRPIITTSPAAASGPSSTSPARRPEYDSRRSSTNHLSAPATPQLASGAITPFSSNPPVVFSSTGTARPSPLSEIETDTQPENNENDARRLAAEAAMRRFGAPASTSSSTPHPLKTAVDVNEIATRPEKGKGKEKEVEFDPEPKYEGGWKGESLDPVPTSTNGADEWDTRPTHIPRLSTVAPPFISQDLRHRLNLQKPNFANEVDGDQHATIQSLEERLKVLREVDETIWGLVGELTRLKSSWPIDGNQHRGDTSVRVLESEVNDHVVEELLDETRESQSL